jgi:hypothetical protein
MENITQTQIKGLIKKYKENKTLEPIIKKIEREFKNGIPCCQPLSEKYCVWFLDFLFDNWDSPEILPIKKDIDKKISWVGETGKRILYC